MRRTKTIIGMFFLAWAITVPALASEPVTIDYVTFVPRMHGISKVLLADLKEIEKKSWYFWLRCNAPLKEGRDG